MLPEVPPGNLAPSPRLRATSEQATRKLRIGRLGRVTNPVNPGRRKGAATSTRVKRSVLVQLVAAIVLGVIVLIVLLQNTAPVEIRVLFTTVAMSGALLLLCTLAIGLMAGVAAAMAVIRRRAAFE